MDPIKLGQALILTLSDWPTEPVDAIFLHGRSFGDDDGLFELCKSLIDSGTARYVAINGSNGEKLNGTVAGEAWPGKDEYFKRLSDLGIKNIFSTMPAFHTREENDAFLQLARERGWKSAITLSQPHQLLRAMRGQVKSMREQNYSMRIYGASPRPCDWQKTVFGSQGKEQKPRFEHIEHELLATYSYGDLASYDELIAYFSRRPNIT